MRSEDDEWSLALVLGNLGGVLLNLARYDDAAIACDESLTLWRRLGSSVGIARVLNNLAFIAMEQNDGSRAAELQREGLILCRDIGNRENIAMCLEGAGRVVAGQGRIQSAVRLWGAADRLRGDLEQPLPPAERSAHEVSLGQARAAIPEPEFERAWNEGHAMSIEQASDYALEELMPEMAW